MFGQRRRLQRNGTPAQAVVTGMRRLGGTGPHNLRCELVLEVRFADGTRGEAVCRFGSARDGSLWVSVGDLVPVRHARRNRARVAVDTAELRARRATRPEH